MAALGLGMMIGGASYDASSGVIFAEDYMWETVKVIKILIDL